MAYFVPLIERYEKWFEQNNDFHFILQQTDAAVVVVRDGGREEPGGQEA